MKLWSRPVFQFAYIFHIFTEGFFESLKIDESQISNYEQLVQTEESKIVDVKRGNIQGFPNPEQISAKIEEKTSGMIKISLSLAQ